MSKEDVKAALKNPRRQFLGQLGLMGAGAVLAGCAPTLAQSSKPNLDVNILNFALNLEYLEAAFYLAATGRLEELYTVDPGARGKVLVDTDVAARRFNGTVAAGTALTLTGVTLEVAHEIASDELAHVKFLRAALGNQAVAAPTIDIRRAVFAAAANAAAGAGGVATPLNPAFDPYANDLFFLHGAFIFEDVGVSAYKGAARFLVDDKANGILEQAAGILSVEAYHAGAIRYALYRDHKEGKTTPYGPIPTVVQLISNLRDSVDGTDDRDQGIVAGAGNPDYVAGPSGITQSNIVLADANGVAFSRTPRQVGNIVFLQANATTGGFYPNGLSGNFTTLLAL